jgi:hypothetical protein
MLKLAQNSPYLAVDFKVSFHLPVSLTTRDGAISCAYVLAHTVCFITDRRRVTGRGGGEVRRVEKADDSINLLKQEYTHLGLARHGLTILVWWHSY